MPGSLLPRDPCAADDGRASSLPSSAHLLLNDKCNARCVFCGGDYFHSRSGKVMTLDKFRAIAEHLHLERFRQVVLAGGGDPLTCPDLEPIVRCLGTSYPGVAVMVTTNGIALSRAVSELLLANGARMVNISINAATRSTYRDLMQVDMFDRVSDNARVFTEVRRARQSSAGLQLSIPIMRRNIEELPQLVDLAREAGAESINVFYCRFYPPEIRNAPPGLLPEDESLFFHQDLSDRILRESEQRAARAGIGLRHEPLFAAGRVARHCRWPQDQLLIGPDGEVFPCGGGELHFRKKVERGGYDFGNALLQPIEEFWNNDCYRAIRVSSGRQGQTPIPECLECANMTSHVERTGHIMKWTDFDGPARQAEGVAAPGPAGSAGRQAAPEARQPRAAAPAARPLVSVVIPTFNRPDRLLDAVASVRAQTYPSLEIVVVNDGGVEIGDRLAAIGDARVKHVRHQENRGLAAARNTGIRATTGKYLAYLDDDDLLYPGHLETLVNALESGSYQVAYTDAYRAHQVLENGSYVTTMRDVPYSVDFDADRMLDANFVPVLCFLHARSCLESVGMFDESLKRLEDWDLWIRMSRKFPFLHLKRITCEFSWRVDGTSMTSLEDDSFAIARRRIRKAYGNVPGLREQLAEAERRRHTEEQRVAVLRKAPSEAIAGLVRCAELSRRRPQTLLWGAGEGGRRARRVLEGLGVAVAGFIDSNRAKAGSVVDGVQVLAPDALDAAEARGCRPLVAIASVAHEAIGRELQRRGWDEGVDYVVLPVGDMPGFE